MTACLKSIVVSSLAALFLSLGIGTATARADDAHPPDGASDPVAAADHAPGDPGSTSGEVAHETHSAGADHPDFNKPPIKPNAGMLQLFLFSLVLFWVFLFVARKLAWLPMIEGLDAREARVNRALAGAEAARIDAQKLVAQHQAQLDEVTEQIKAIIAEARTTAEQEKTRIIAEADSETTAMRDQAIAEIHAASEEALSGLDDRIDSQVTTATQHVLG